MNAGGAKEGAEAPGSFGHHRKVVGTTDAQEKGKREKGGRLSKTHKCLSFF